MMIEYYLELVSCPTTHKSSGIHQCSTWLKLNQHETSSDQHFICFCIVSVEFSKDYHEKLTFNLIAQCLLEYQDVPFTNIEARIHPYNYHWHGTDFFFTWHFLPSVFLFFSLRLRLSRIDERKSTSR